MTFLSADIDECQNGPVCQENARCQNIAGSYRCDCKPGYRFISSGRCVGTAAPPCVHASSPGTARHVHSCPKTTTKGPCTTYSLFTARFAVIARGHLGLMYFHLRPYVQHLFQLPVTPDNGAPGVQHRRAELLCSVSVLMLVCLSTRKAAARVRPHRDAISREMPQARPAARCAQSVPSLFFFPFPLLSLWLPGENTDVL